MKLRIVLTLFAFVFLMTSTANAQPSSQEIIAKYRKAIGGTANAQRLYPSIFKREGEYFLYSLKDGKIFGEHFPFEAKVWLNKANYVRSDITMKIGIVNLTWTEVKQINKGWYQFNQDPPVAMDKDFFLAAEDREELWAIIEGEEAFDKGWTFSEPKQEKVRGQNAWVIVANKKGINSITMYFDTQNYMLLRLSEQSSDYTRLLDNRKVVTSFRRDVYLLSWKKYGNVMFPSDMEWFRDGVLHRTARTISIDFPSRIDDAIFEMPKNDRKKSNAN